MAVFTYEANDLEARLVRGTLIADTPRDARDRLREQGLSILQLVDRAQADTSGSLFRRLLVTFRGSGAVAGGTSGGGTMFLRELSTLLEVGTPMLEALDTVVRQYSRKKRGPWLALRDRVAAGGSLAEAMRDAQHHGRRLFDPVTRAMVEVGEDAGRLGEVLEETAVFQERAGELKNRLASALIYPAVVSVVGVAVCLFLMTYVVPGLLESLAEAQRELPWITGVVKGTSDLLVGYGLWLVLGAVAASFGFVAVLRTDTGRLVWDRLLLRLPGAGDIVRKQAVVRLSFVLSTLLRSGVPFERAVGIAQGVTRNRVLRDALRDCETAVEAGRDLGPALEATKAFPPTVVQVFALGQASGNLEVLLDRLAGAYDRQVATLTGRLTALIEPVLIVLLAVAVGVIAFATILPILEIGNTLN